ncbi:ABC transporter permease [Insolitispirillum peregrinum]|uniref:ABC transporter permease n=1 Tax=Insolitispirillum peregrinum TaxID=80876 RepID=UPI00361A797A
MAFKLEARGASSRRWVYGAPVLAVLLTLVFGGILFALLGFEPLAALYTFFISPLNSAYGVAELLVKAAPLALCAVGLALGFRGNVWNIGAEGQLTMGAVTGGGVALALGDGGAGWWVLPLVMLAGMAGGMLWGMIPAWLKTRFHASEILVSLMLTYVADLFLSMMVHGPWRDPDGYGFPQSPMFGDAATLPVLWAGTRLHLGVLLALLAVAVGWFVIARTFIGFQIKVMGLTPVAGGYAGFSHKRIIWMSFLLSGALAGLAGVCEVAGPIGQLQPVISPGYGFTAIIVAFLGRLHPVGILLASLLMALSYLGGEAVQISMRLPLAVTGVFQGMLLFFLLACDVLIRYRLRWLSSVREAG